MGMPMRRHVKYTQRIQSDNGKNNVMVKFVLQVKSDQRRHVNKGRVYHWFFCLLRGLANALLLQKGDSDAMRAF